MNKKSCAPLLVLLACGLLSCGGNSKSTTTTTTPPSLPSMAGSWDITLTSSDFDSGNEVIALQAILVQDNNGNLSASGPVTASGPSDNLFEAFLMGSSLSNATNVGVDFLGAACGGNDDGTRNLTGTINSSNQVTLTLARGGSQTVTITGTLSTSATPPFSGTFTISAPGCGSDGDTGSVTALQPNGWSGSYSGTPTIGPNDTVTFSLTPGSNNSLSGSGTDTQNGNFTLTGNTVGDAAAVTSTPSGGGSATNFFAYYDSQLGANGSMIVTVFSGANTSCPTGATQATAGGGCLYGIFAKQ